jgi:hypothetical protein
MHTVKPKWGEKFFATKMTKRHFLIKSTILPGLSVLIVLALGFRFPGLLAKDEGQDARPQPGPRPLRGAHAHCGAHRTHS